MTDDPHAQFRRINGEMLETIDEELELEIDDDRLAKLLAETAEHSEPDPLGRHVYFKELLRLQGELVKLQILGRAQEAQGRDHLRGARLSGQGRRHQTDHSAP
jgi:hypothetical protein